MTTTAPVAFDRAVCLSPLPWSGHWTSRHELCAELARRGTEVVFVDPPHNALRRRDTVADRPTPDGLRVTTPPDHLPFGVLHRWPALAERVIHRNARRYADHVVAACGDGGGARTLLINSFLPVHGYLVASALTPDAFLYHRADDLASFPTVRPHYLELERRIVAEADAVAAVSPAVRQGIAAVRPDAAVVRNGVDLDRFASASPDPRMADLPRPIAVVVGQVDHRTDPRMLADLAAAITVVVAGPVAAGHHLPAGCVALGRVDPTRIPAVLVAADVAVVPYVGFAGDPLKVYEYLAAGLPVAGVAGPWSVDHPAIDVLRLVDDPADLPAAVVASARDRHPAADALRRAVAAEHSWARRVDDLLALVDSPRRRAVAA